MIQFLEFEFDEVQTLLYKNGQVVPLNSTQSKVLALFISHPERIFSKEDILANVWQDKVVSEQVVFQNISQLRGILGDGAIKTFPKKGYQWQLELSAPLVDAQTELKTGSAPTPTAPPVEQAHTPEPTEIKQPTGNIKKQANLPTLVSSLLLMCLAIGFFWYKSQQQSQTNGVAAVNHPVQQGVSFIPLIADSQRHFKNDLDTLNGLLEFANTGPSLDAREFFNSPFMQYHSSGQTHGLIFTGILKHNSDTATKSARPYLLELLVQGPERGLTSYLYAESMTDLAQQVTELLTPLSRSNFFNVKSDALVSAELTLINEQLGDALHGIPLLAKQLIEEDKFDAASGYIELLLSRSELTHPLYYGYAKWLKGLLFQAKRDANTAQIHFDQADLLFSDAMLYDLQAEVNKSLAELAHSVAHTKEDYNDIRRYLYKAASLARLGKKPVSEIRAYTLLSIKASKFGLKKERIDYLIQAKTLLAEYQLDGSHYMLPMYHFALFADNVEERIHFYNQVLNKPVTPENYWVYFSSADHLSRLYLQEQKPELALEVVKKITDPARSALLHAKYYREFGDSTKAIDYAKTAFNLGRGQHMNWLSLNSALILLELSQIQGESHQLTEYREFITEHANEWWLNWRKDRLAKVGITVPEQMVGL